jgi:hypothetical protein
MVGLQSEFHIKAVLFYTIGGWGCRIRKKEVD